MSRSPSRSSTRTLPPFSPAERAAGARDGTSPPSGRSSHGKPEPPPGLMPIGRAPPGLGRARGDPPEHMRNRKERPWHARGDPPGHADPWGDPLEHGPPGFLPDGNAFPWSASGDPPGWSSSRAETRRRSHGPPRQARGDPEPLGQAPPTYGLLSGPSHLARTSYHKDPHRHRGATGPPGAKTAGAVNVWPPPGDETLGRAPPVLRRARGDPPGRVRTSRRGPPGLLPIGRGPPGPTRISHSSLSAGRCRERNPDARPETGRHDATCKPKPKSRKITPWL